MSLVTSRLSRPSETARANLSLLPTTPLLSASLRLSIMPCWPRLVSTILLVTTIHWELLVESTSVCALFPSQTPETLISSEPCPEPEKLVNKSNEICQLYIQI